MKLRKSLINKISNTNLGILLRNSFKFKPVIFKHLKESYPICVSDAFLWRTDNNYKTKFKYTDILNLFYKIKNSWVELHFYSKNNELIKIESLKNLNISNEHVIDSKYLNNLKDYGTFYIYHFSDNTENFDNQNIISNRCYVGYSQNNNLYSFMHGNTYGKFTSIYPSNIFLTDIVQNSLFKNYEYKIQKYFNNFDKNELFFINPTSKTIKFSIESKNYILKSNCSTCIKTKGSIISFKSNCLFFRPIIFSYKDNYMDVHHS